MANVTNAQILVDGPRNVVVKFEGTITATQSGSYTTIIDPSLLSALNINNQLATKLRIDKIVYDVEDLLTLNLYWDAATPVVIWNLAGRGKVDSRHYGGLQNNATSPTGKITANWDYEGTAQTLTFTIVLDLVKQ